MTPAEILRAAKAKIEDPKHWCQGGYAQTGRGRLVGPNERAACRWCSNGAVLAVTGAPNEGGPPFQMLREAAEEMGFGAFAVIKLNDGSDHATVMKMFDRAIELAEAEK